MTLTWYKILNIAELTDTGLVQKSVAVILGPLGAQTVIVTVGNYISCLFDETFVSASMNDVNPFFFEDHGIIIDDNNDLWVGLLSEN